jgi:type II secretory pathway pseudopilin PulG
VAFTLIELLLVIAIVALLIAILIPALSSARLACFQARELSAAQQLMAAFSLYANDNKSAVLPGYPTAAMVAGPIVVTDESGERLSGELAQRYPWRLAPYLDFNFRGLYKDYRLITQLRESEAQYQPLGVDFRYAISLFPSLGMNTAFIGGSANHLAFNSTATGLYGKFYVTRVDEPQRTDRLIVFCSARAEAQPALPGLGQPQGYFRVDAPNFLTRNWQAGYDANAAFPGLNSGFVACRYAAKAVTGLFDGHAALANWEALQDMRRWSQRATRADWRLGQP